jgi:transposase-like protein
MTSDFFGLFGYFVASEVIDLHDKNCPSCNGTNVVIEDEGDEDGEILTYYCYDCEYQWPKS